jgi:hypothetical protein
MIENSSNGFNASGYPRRESHFAHRFVRVLHKSCAAQDIGPAACYLCCVIAHTEDAGRYVGPARFWNSQLSETMGFRSPQQLERERRRAVGAGWLVYRRPGTRAVGEYFVTIPERFASLSDAPLERVGIPPILSDFGNNSSEIHSENGTNSGINSEDFVTDSFRFRNESVTEPGKPPIPIPIPSSTTSPTAAEGFAPWPLKDGTFWPLPQAKLDQWRAAYRNIDVDAKLRDLWQWSEDNPAKRKLRGGILRHLNGCLCADNEKARPQAEPKGRVATQADFEAAGYTFIDARGDQ